MSQGEILFNGRNLLKMDRKELDQVRGKELSMIFQDPLSSLNPVLTIGKQLEEGLKAHTELEKRSAGNGPLICWAEQESGKQRL